MHNNNNAVEASKLVELRNILTHQTNQLLTDGDCHRFLVARSFDLHKSVDMINHWQNWFENPLVQNNSKLVPKSILSVEDINEHIYGQFCPHSNLGEDKDGRPIYWEKTGASNFFFLNVY
jgi:hypothetical protein